VSVLRYHETIWSEIYPGNRHTSHCLRPAVEAAEIALDLSPKQRKRTVWRVDGGGGSDDHLRWLFQRGYQVVAKGMNNRRAKALAKQVQRWDPYEEGSWLGEVPPPCDYGRPVRVFVKKRLKKDQFLYSYYVNSLSLPSKRFFLTGYDDRGGAEIEQFRNDKSGLGLEARRKHSFLGQKGYILLTDLAHNLLADFYHRALIGSPFEGYGPKRIVRDLLAVPGRIILHEDRVQVQLLSLKQFSKDLIICLERYCSGR
jgi:hypothetical protein